MTSEQYTTALSTLSLTPDHAAEWLGIGRSTAYRYLKEGAPGPVARALDLALHIARHPHIVHPGIIPGTQPNLAQPVHDLTPPEPTP